MSTKYLKDMIALQLAIWDGDASTDKHQERAEQLIMMIHAHDAGVAKYGEPNWKDKGPPPIVVLATEFGYKQCEKGNNLEATMKAMRRMYE